MKNLIPGILTALKLIMAAVVIAEITLGPGTGEEKKALVIAELKAKLPDLAALLGVPAALVSFLMDERVLSFLVDAIVTGINKAGGWLNADPTQAPRIGS